MRVPVPALIDNDDGERSPHICGEIQVVIMDRTPMLEDMVMIAGSAFYAYLFNVGTLVRI